MKSGRFGKYLESRKGKKTDPMQSKGDVQSSNDSKIDQDFSGYADGPAKESLINPKTSTQKKTAAVDTKDGEKQITEEDKKEAYKEKETGSSDSI